MRPLLGDSIMTLLRTLAIATALAAGGPAFAQDPETIRITATQSSGRPTLMAYFGQHPLPVTVDALLAQLNQPNVCGKAAAPVPSSTKPCAIIAYYLANQDETRSTPQLAFRAIQYVTHPDKPEDTTLRIIDIDGKVKSYNDERIDEPLRPMRVPNSCKRVWDLKQTNGGPTPGVKVKKCKRVDALYLPFGILGYIENDEQKILTGDGKKALFTLAVAEDQKSSGSQQPVG